MPSLANLKISQRSVDISTHTPPLSGLSKITETLEQSQLQSPSKLPTSLKLRDGKSVSYEDAYTQWLSGAVFGQMPADGGNTFFMAPSSRSLCTFFRGLSTNMSLDSTRLQGSFNMFSEMSPEDIDGLTIDGLTIDGSTHSIGFRASKRELVSHEHRVGAWQEAWMVLQAAAIGLHPFVYACVLVDSRPCYVMRKGVTIHDIINSGVIPSDDIGNDMHDALQAASEAGLLMIDIKTPNIVYLKNNERTRKSSS